MPFEDPFYSGKEEVTKALAKTQALYQRWTELQIDSNNINHQIEREWTTTELRNSLRSIEWELEDLEDSISIVEKNSSKFKLDSNELVARRNFIDQIRQQVKPLLENLAAMKSTSTHSTAKYTKLENQVDSPERTQFMKTAVVQQAEMLRHQDDQLDLVANSIGSLKTMSTHIGVELDEQAGMLDELQNEMEQTDSRIDSTIKKVAKVLHLSNDRSQWIAIGILSSLLLVILGLFALL